MNREEWLEERKKGIGGSDAAVVIGKSKWKNRKKFLYCKNRRQNFNRRRGTRRNRARTSRNSIRYYL